MTQVASFFFFPGLAPLHRSSCTCTEHGTPQSEGASPAPSCEAAPKTPKIGDFWGSGDFWGVQCSASKEIFGAASQEGGLFV